MEQKELLENKQVGAQVNNLQFNRHSRKHFYRAALEGIAFSFVYGMEVLKSININPEIIKVGNDNLFQSEVFSMTIANLLNCDIEMMDTTGAIGAALASGLATKEYSSLEEAISFTKPIKVYTPNNTNGVYEDAYRDWTFDLKKLINN